MKTFYALVLLGCLLISWLFSNYMNAEPSRAYYEIKQQEASSRMTEAQIYYLYHCN